MDEKRSVKQALAEESLLWFTRIMFKARFNSRFIVNPHHELICEYLQRTVAGTLPDGARNLIINMPPRYGKTELAVINFMAWCLAVNPACKFIHLSYSDKLALDNSAQTRELMREPAYAEFWPIEWKQDADAKGLWKTSQGGGVYAVAAGGAITGFGAGSTEGDRFAGAIIIDDPLKVDDAKSDVERGNVNDRLVTTIMSRRNSRVTPIILIMQRLHEDDMTGYVLAGKTGEKWHHLKLPALNDNGEALWPHKHTADELNVMKGVNGYVFSGQYQQEPTPDDGIFFTRDMFVEYDVPPRHLHTYGASDYAVTEGGGDATEHGLFGIDHREDMYILDWWHGHTASDKWVEALLDLAEAGKPLAWAEESGQIIKSVGPYINKRMMERRVYFNRVQYASAADKPTRARSIQARMSARKIYVPRGKPWVSDLIDQCLKFPLGTKDDKVDVLSLFGRMLDGLTPGQVPADPKKKQELTLDKLFEQAQAAKPYYKRG